MSQREFCTFEYPSLPSNLSRILGETTTEENSNGKGHVTTKGRVLVAALLSLAARLPASCLASPPQQLITPSAAEAQPFTTSPPDFTATNPPGKADGKSPDFGIPPLESIDFRGQLIGTSPADRTAEIFAQQMQYLQDNGYHVITFSDLANYFEKGKNYQHCQ